jgi:hypothetical protein
MASRFDDVRLRARRAKTAVAACAVALFAVVGVVARTTHPGASTSSKAQETNTGLSSSTDELTFDDGEVEDDGDDSFSGFGGATITPSPTLTAPSASTGTS